MLLDLQYIIKDKYRLAVIEDLSNGELSSERIAKKNHMPAPAVERAIRELRSEEIVGGPDTSLYLTETGKDMFRQLKDLDHAGIGNGNAAARSRPPDRVGGADSRRRKENQGT